MSQNDERYVPHRLYRWERRAPRWLAPICWLGMLLIWEAIAAAEWIPAVYLPGPSAIVRELIRLMMSGDLGTALIASAGRWGVGMLGGGLIGMILALAVGLERHCRAVLEPLVYVLYPIPKIAILPLLILWLGIGEAPKWLIIGLGVFFPVFMNTLQGIERMPRIYYEVAAVYPTSMYRFIRVVVLPAIWPAVFTGLRLGSGTALVLLVAAEMIAAETGIGALILHYGDLMLTTSLLACVLVLSWIGLLVQLGLQYWERWVVTWK